MFNKKGSISLEAALEIGFVTLFMFALMGILQNILVYTITSNAVLSVSEKISEYSVIFFQSGLENVDDSIKNKAISKINVSDDKCFAEIATLAEKGIDAIESTAWQAAAKSIAETEIENELEKFGLDIFEINVTSLFGSSFFLTGNDFTIVLETESPYLLPFVFGENVISQKAKASGSAWFYGAFSGYSVSDINVWELDNFKRGKVLEAIYNGNLPENFPTIDIYDEKAKQATMIASIDITAPTNKNVKNLKSTILSFAKKLSEFDGGEADGTKINGEDIKSKKLLLILPENSPTEEQSEVLMEVAITCGSKYNIKLEIKSYQVSEKYEESE